MKSIQKYKLTFTPLTPCHIGSGHQYEPFEYVFRNNIFYKINIGLLLSDLPNEKIEDFYKLCDGGSIVDLRNLIAKKFDTNPEKYTLFTAETTGSIQKHYTEKFNDYQNQLQINACQHSSLSQKPLLPGSSIKGAIRTAVLAVLAEGNELKPFKFEEYLLRYKNPSEDPFKFINVSDAEFPLNSTKIYFVYNRPRDANYEEKEGLPPFAAEFLSSIICINKDNEMDFQESPSFASVNFVVKQRFKVEDLFDDCKSFYTNLLSSTKDLWKNFDNENLYEFLLKSASKRNNSFLLRCGRFSGKESFCVPQVMDNKIPKCINLAGGSLFCGWFKVVWEKIN